MSNNPFVDLTMPYFARFPEEERIYLSLLDSEFSSPDYDHIMWATALFTHPQSVYAKASSQEKKALINQQFPNVATLWDTPAFLRIQDLYKKLNLSKKRQYLLNWETKLDERESFIASIFYNESTYEMLDKMMAQTEKMWKQYLMCLKDVEDEDADETFGKFQESLSDKNII